MHASPDHSEPSPEDSTAESNPPEAVATDSTPTTVPTPSARRVQFIDVLRGVALCGIFPVNLPYFAMPVEYVDTHFRALESIDRWAQLFTGSFFTFRFITLFSFLFGVGLVLLARKCERDQLPFRSVFTRRMLSLLLFGLGHVIFLWYGDILFYYAAVGMAVVGVQLLRATRKTQLFVAVASFLFPLLILSVVLLIPGAAEKAIPTEIRPAEDPELAAAAVGPLGEFLEVFLDEESSFAAAFEIAVYTEGSYGRQMITRVITWMFAGIVGLFIMVPRIIALFLFGIASAQNGWVLNPQKNRAALRRCLIFGFGLGLPLQGVATYLLAVDPTPQRVIAATIFQYLGSFGMSAGYLGIVGLLCSGETVPRLLRPFGCLGRMAFTQYILQSVIAATIFYGWGFGLFGQLDFAALYLVALGVWIFGLVSSTWWLSKFPHGPLEALWRKLTYWGVRPIATAPRSSSPRT